MFSQSLYTAAEQHGRLRGQLATAHRLIEHILEALDPATPESAELQRQQDNAYQVPQRRLPQHPGTQGRSSILSSSIRGGRDLASQLLVGEVALREAAIFSLCPGST